MIDIHTHILPGVDDGSRNLEESIAMAQLEMLGGTSTIVATPHIYNSADLRRSLEFVPLVEQLQAEFDNLEIGIRLVQGAEVYPMMEIMDALDEGLPITLGPTRKYLLLDLPLGAWPMTMDHILFGILSRGITPILAHPERTAPVQESLSFLAPHLEKGVLCQINAGSIMGGYGEMARQRAHEILSNQWASFLATDMHRAKKKPGLKAAADYFDDLPSDYIHLITTENPGRAINGLAIKPIDPILAPAPQKQGFFAKLLRR